MRPPIIDNARGNCNSTPMPLKNNKGVRANTVVRLVITIGYNLLLPPSKIAFSIDKPLAKDFLMVSILIIESLITIPAITIIPRTDIIFREELKMYKKNNAPLMSNRISNNIIIGNNKDSNCAASIKYSRISEMEITFMNSLKSSLLW